LLNPTAHALLDGQTEAPCGVLIPKPRVHWAHPKIRKAACQEAGSTVSGTGFRALGTMLPASSALLLGMPKGSPGGTWAIRPSAVLLKLLARRWLECFGAVPAGRQFIAATAQRMVQWFVPFAKDGLPLPFPARTM